MGARLNSVRQPSFSHGMKADSGALVPDAKCFKQLARYRREGFVVEEKPEASSDELDDEYLPACCRNGGAHTHPV